MTSSDPSPAETDSESQLAKGRAALARDIAYLVVQYHRRHNRPADETGNQSDREPHHDGKAVRRRASSGP